MKKELSFRPSTADRKVLEQIHAAGYTVPSEEGQPMGKKRRKTGMGHPDPGSRFIHS
jgi:hypothetical protein